MKKDKDWRPWMRKREEVWVCSDGELMVINWAFTRPDIRRVWVKSLFAAGAEYLGPL